MLTRREFACAALASAGVALARVRRAGAAAWRCEVFGPAFSRAEYRTLVRRDEVAALLAPGVLERGRYVVRFTSGARVRRTFHFERG